MKRNVYLAATPSFTFDRPAMRGRPPRTHTEENNTEFVCDFAPLIMDGDSASSSGCDSPDHFTSDSITEPSYNGEDSSDHY